MRPDVIPDQKAVCMEMHEYIMSPERHRDLLRQQRSVAAIAQSAVRGRARENQGPLAGQTPAPELPANGRPRNGYQLCVPQQTVASQKLFATKDRLFPVCARVNGLLAKTRP